MLPGQDSQRRGVDPETATTDRFAHPALFYRGADEYLAATVDFIEAGLDAGDPVAVAVPGPNLELIREALGDRAAGVHLFDLAEAGLNPGRIIPGVLLAYAAQHNERSIRVVGEPIWPGRTAAEYPACAQHEALINLAFAGRAASILCPYDAARLDPHVLADAARTHPVVIDADGPRRSPGYAPEQVIAAYNLPLRRPDGINVSGFLFSGDHLGQISEYAVAHGLRLGLSRGRADDLQAAVVELASNSVRHGGGRGTLEIWGEDGTVICQVRDAGTIRDPLAGRLPVPVESPCGRGLLLVHRLADLVRTYTTSLYTTTRIYFYAEPAWSLRV